MDEAEKKSGLRCVGEVYQTRSRCRMGQVKREELCGGERPRSIGVL